MSSDTELININNIIKQCVRCGQCRSVCPVFQSVGIESAAPRGKVFLAHLLANGTTPVTREARKHLSLCLLCGTCSEECPVGVDVPQIVMSARAKAAPGTASLLMAAAGTVLANRKLTLPALKTAASLAKLPIDKNSGKGLSCNFKEQSGKPRVGYFIGCATEAYFPQIARDTVRVLSAAGFEVIVPPGPACCGVPLQAQGQIKKARRLNRRNLNFFIGKGVQHIVTDCASCCSTLTDQVTSEPDFSNKLEIWDLNAFLIQNAKLPGLTGYAGATHRKVTYHDPCHHSRRLKLIKQPRELLLSLPGLEYVEMKAANRCCGGSGSFMASHPELSLAIAQTKMENIAATEAETVLTSCPSCRIQLNRALLSNNLGHISIKHPVELVAEAMLRHQPQDKYQQG